MKQIGAKFLCIINSNSDKADTTDSRFTDARTPKTHTHDDRYFTKTEVNKLLDQRAGIDQVVSFAGVTIGDAYFYKNEKNKSLIRVNVSGTYYYFQFTQNGLIRL